MTLASCFLLLALAFAFLLLLGSCLPFTLLLFERSSLKDLLFEALNSKGAL
jgi:hypothetical protein